MHMVTHGARYAYAARRAFGLEPNRHINGVTMQVGFVPNGIADVDPDPKADRPVGGLVTVEQGDILLHFDRAPHGPLDAVEHHEQGVASGLDNPPAMRADGRIDEIAAEPRSRSRVSTSSSPISRL